MSVKKAVHAVIGKLLAGRKTESAVAEVAKYMSERLKVGTMLTCRAMVVEAINYSGVHYAY